MNVRVWFAHILNVPMNTTSPFRNTAWNLEKKASFVKGMATAGNDCFSEFDCFYRNMICGKETETCSQNTYTSPSLTHVMIEMIARMAKYAISVDVNLLSAIKECCFNQRS